MNTENLWNEPEGENRRTSKKLSHCHQFYMDWPGIEPGLKPESVSFIIIIINNRSVSRVTTAPANVSSVFQLFSFLVVCFKGLVAFFASVKASSVCIHLSCLVCIQSAVHDVRSRLFCSHEGCNNYFSIISYLRYCLTVRSGD